MRWLDYFLKSRGVENDDALDECVHEAASRAASDANNEGFDGQLDYLTEAVGPSMVATMVAGVAGVEISTIHPHARLPWGWKIISESGLKLNSVVSEPIDDHYLVAPLDADGNVVRQNLGIVRVSSAGPHEDDDMKGLIEALRRATGIGARSCSKANARCCSDCPGWRLAEFGKAPYYSILACQACGVFFSDEAAMRHVLGRVIASHGEIFGSLLEEDCN